MRSGGVRMMFDQNQQTHPQRPYAQPGEADDEIDLMALLATLWRGKFWITLLTGLAVLAGGYYVYRIAVRKYTSIAVVVLDNRKQSVVDFSNVISGLSGDQASMNTEVAVLHSRNLAMKLVSALDLTRDPEFNAWLRPRSPYAWKTLVKRALGMNTTAPTPAPEQQLNSTVDQVLHAISVSNKRQSYVFDITVTTTSPTKSAEMANKLADLYILDQLDVKFEATQKATKWLTGRVAELKAKLEQAAEKVKAFNSRTTLVSPEALTLLNNQLKGLRERVVKAKNAAAGLAAHLGELKAARASGDLKKMVAVADDRALTHMLELVQAGTLQRDSLDARFDQIIARAKIESDRATSQAAALAQSVTSLEAQIAKQSKDLVTLQQLQREADASQQIYKYFLGRLKETSVQQGIQQADSRVLSAAVVPMAASSPRRELVIVLSGLLGFMAGAALILGREMMHNTFRTAEELESITGYTVIGQVPRIPVRRRRDMLDYVLEKPSSRAAEAIRNLRTSILLSNVDNPPKVVMSTSTLPKEGKTTQAIMLAQNMAAIGKKVLLVEGDIRRRAMSEYFDGPGERGLVAVLAGDATFDEVVYHDEQLNLDILIGEKPKINAADLFSSAKFAAFLREMRERYDLVVIDTPPVLVVPDARVIGPFVDAIIYSVEWNKTSKMQLRQGLAMFESVGLKVTGLVLNQISPKGMKRYGYGNYGSYGHYAKGYYES